MDIDKNDVVDFFQDTHQKLSDVRDLLNSGEIDLASEEFSITCAF